MKYYKTMAQAQEEIQKLLVLLSDDLGKRILELPTKWRRYTEGETIKKIQPPEEVVRLRLAFWYEWEQATAEGRNMCMHNVYRGICGDGYWNEVVVPDDKYLAFVTTQPTSFNVFQRNLFSRALDRMAKILDKDDSKYANAQVKIYQMLEKRVQGVMPEKLQVYQKSVNLNAHYMKNVQGKTGEDVEQLAQQAPMMPLDELEAAVNQLEEGNRATRAKDVLRADKLALEQSFDQPSPAARKTTKDEAILEMDSPADRAEVDADE